MTYAHFVRSTFTYSSVRPPKAKGLYLLVHKNAKSLCTAHGPMASEIKCFFFEEEPSSCCCKMLNYFSNDPCIALNNILHFSFLNQHEVAFFTWNLLKSTKIHLKSCNICCFSPKITDICGYFVIIFDYLGPSRIFLNEKDFMMRYYKFYLIP